MANKFIQGKAGEALAYPKTLAEAVFLEENGESIAKDILELPVDREVLSTALNVLYALIKGVKAGMTDKGVVLTVKDIRSNLAGTTGVLSSVAGKLLKDRADTNEEIASTALNQLCSLLVIASSIAPVYDKNEVYSVGDAAVFENALYECLVAGGGIFNPAHWKRTDLLTYIKEHLINA